MECVDNDETAAVIANLVGAQLLVLLTSVEGIYLDPSDPSTLVERISGVSYEDMEKQIDKLMENCNGSSRVGTAGAKAKLKFAKESLKKGTKVIIAHARHRLSDIIEGKVKCTVMEIEK